MPQPSLGNLLTHHAAEEGEVLTNAFKQALIVTARAWFVLTHPTRPDPGVDGVLYAYLLDLYG
jgi:hypothetical protein